MHNIPWTDVEIGEDSNQKPFHLPRSPHARPEVKFNVSHQAGLVAIIASRSNEVGIDIVCVGERGDEEDVQAVGFEQWLTTYEDAFSSRDIEAMNSDKDLQKEGRSVELVKLRRFFAYWALKEAFVKMTGEALLADWLKDTEFTNLKAPSPSTNSRNEPWGDTIENIGIKVKGKIRTDVKMSITAFEESYMIATSVKMESSMTLSSEMNFTSLDLVNDILPHTMTS